MGLASYLEPNPKNTQVIVLHRAQPWYKAYMESLFEYDSDRLSARIQKAQELIGTRQRELLAGPSNALERRALKEALQALKALQTCIEH